MILLCGERELRWECPRCGVDLTESVETGKIVAIRSPGKNTAGETEELVRCLSCEKLVKPERSESG